MKKQITLVIFVLLSIFSTSSQAQNGVFHETEYGYVLKNINYMQYFQGEEYMDAYISYNATPAQPFVVLIHGGGFTTGDKKQMEELAVELLKNNINSVSVNYSLLSKKFFKDGNSTTYQTMIHNIWNAIQHVQMKSTEWNVRKTDYILIGEEVGAYLALLSGYNFHSEINSIIAISPITDLRDIAGFNRLARRNGQEKVIFSKLLGGEEFKTSKFLSQAYMNASPIDQARDIPTVFIHGVKDQVIPYSQSAKLYKLLKDNGIYTRINSIENGGANLLADPQHKDHVIQYITNGLKYSK